MKTCRACNATKPLEDFSKRKDTRDGLNYKCRACDSAYQAKRYEQKADHIKAKAKEWGAANQSRKRENNATWRAANVDKRREYNAQWYAANGDKARAAMAEWHKQNAQHRREYNAEWRRANAGVAHALKAKRRAAQLNATPAWADYSLIRDLYAYARIMREAGVDCHVDHIVPLRGENVCGLHTAENLTVIPAVENLKKRNKFATV